MKLITWNIQWGRGADGSVDLERTLSHAMRFSDFDVLCLQEVSSGYPELTGGDGEDQFETLARSLPGYNAVTGVATDVPGLSGRKTFGNMILSRYPVLQVFRHLLPWPAEPDSPSMQRIALEATLDTPLGHIRFTTTHLEYYSPMQRQLQVERLRELHREAVAHAHNIPGDTPQAEGPFLRLPRGGPAILTGDFNFRPESTERQILLSPIDAATPAYRDAWELIHTQTARTATIGVYDKVQWPGEPFTCDFIFVSEDLAGKVKNIQVDSVTDASDHQPMLIELG